MKAPGVSEITDLTIVPWGNAKLEPSGAVQCQHGANECIANTIECCGIALSNSTDQWFSFLRGFEAAYEPSWRSLLGGAKKMEAAAATVAGSTALDADALKTCYTGPQGKKLSMQAYQDTKGLQPPHQYTPWVTVDGTPGDMDKWNDDTLLKKICAAYTGTKPQGCSEAYLASLKSVPLLSDDARYGLRFDMNTE